MKITINVPSDVTELEVTINQTGTSASPDDDESVEQRESQLDALVMPAESREPRELDARHRPDSYGFTDDPDQKRKQTIGFSRS